MTRFHIETTYDQLLIALDGAPFARYRFRGARRPYLWPVNAAEGSVVRGAGTGDHPHQQGLYLAYGLHGHNGATNIWSDWDEPPYGPCGAMHHTAFERVSSDGFEERLVYTNGDGRPIAEERRQVTFQAGEDGLRRIEWTSHVLSLEEPVRAPFHFAARPATSILQDGRVTSSARDGASAREKHRADWMAFAGALGEGRAGLIVHDDPGNPDPQGEFWFPSVLLVTHEVPQPFPVEGVVLRFHVAIFSGEQPPD